MKNLKLATFGLSFLIALLCLFGCKRASEVVSENKHLCDQHGGYHGIYATNSQLPRLLLCKDGSVKWGK